MHSKLRELLTTRRFLPLFSVQSLAAFNDNLFRYGLLILITYKISLTAISPQTLAALLGVIYILPFFVFSATAGKIADYFEKTFLIRLIKIVEIGAMVLATVGFATHRLSILIPTLFLLGAHSAMFGPIKYSILPQHLKNDELISGNALVEASTFLFILLGTLLGNSLMAFTSGEIIVSIVGVAVAIAGLITSFYIPLAPAFQTTPMPSFNIWKDTKEILWEAHQNTQIFAAIIAISWFWLVGFIFLTEFASFTKITLGASESVISLFLVFFSSGIAIGSLVSDRLQAGEISAKYVPLGIAAMTLFIFDLYFASRHSVGVVNGEVTDLVTFLSSLHNWRMLLDVLCMSIGGGVYVVPLYAIIQSLAKDSHRSRIMAANNIVNSLFMVGGSVIIAMLLFIHFTLPQLFLVVAFLNLGMAIYICKLLPEAVLKSYLCWLLKFLYQVKVTGLENYRKAGKRTVIVANHVSFLDGLLLAAFLPDKMLYAVHSQIANVWWIKPFIRLVDAFPMDATRPMLTKSLIKEIREDKRCIIFPEGRITNTGALMKIYEGPGMIADKADAEILPIRIDGAQYSVFSRLKGKLRLRWFPKITITILPPTKFSVPAELHGRKRRHFISKELYDLMSDLIVDTSDYQRTLFQALLDAAKTHGKKQVVLEDIERKKITYRRVIFASFTLGNYLSYKTAPQEFVGILMPNMVATGISFFALHAYGRTPVMLNITAGALNIVNACVTAEIKTVITSRQFIVKARLEKVVEALLQSGIHLLYLEDLKRDLGVRHKFMGFCYSLAPNTSYRYINPELHPEQAAAVLFTSGSEGSPKGVVLSHTNILANRVQLLARIDFTSQDVVFNSLPLFHAFGLTGGLMLPILSGIKTFLYPSPLHYRIISELVYDTNSTIFFATDTFLSGYARVAHPYDFYSVRYVFAGAEKLKPQTAKLWSEKFGVRVLEGYGATETSPVLAMNTPMQHKIGTVGRLLPKIDYKLEPVEGLTVGGRLFVSGPNIMLGYLLIDKPGVITPPPEGWYDTGDVVDIDEDGFVTLLGRSKRFAKIGGEMVSLTAVEDYISALWPDKNHAVVFMPDPRRGEQLVLVTEMPDATRQSIVQYFQSRGIAEIFLPRQIIFREKMPLLPTGKMDYVAVAALVKAELEKVV
jgi:acyl-[acyl-carrier-protein]-phospholipid O-acyltransferase/long-chain-fatty-acid--[acyl-carrier-protein] ligase